MSRRRLGELLVERGIIAEADLNVALLAQKQTKAKLGATLVQMGALSEDRLALALSEALGIALVELSGPPDWSAVHLIRSRFCEQHELFPYALERAGPKRQLLVAMSDPLNTPAIQQIEFTTGLNVGVRLATVSRVRAAILRWYHKVDPTRAGLPAVGVKPNPEEEVVVGEEIISGSYLVPVTERADGTKDVSQLFKSQDDASAKLEQKFWALMRVLSKKGVITRDEFSAELEDGD